MALEFARPDIAELVLRVFDRPVHPEFFSHHYHATVKHAVCELDIRFWAAGHVITFRRQGHSVAEAMTLREQELPEQGCRLEQRVRGCRTLSLSELAGRQYDVSVQLEQMDWELFVKQHEELQVDAMQADVAFMFPPKNRLTPAPLSLLRIEFGVQNVMVHAYHTFPDHQSIVKTQSLLEWL